MPALYNQSELVIDGVPNARGVMKREIFLYGHFDDGFSLGRYICPDDLSKMQNVKKAPMALRDPQKHHQYTMMMFL